MVCVNQTRPHCVNQTGKTQSTALAERHARGTAWEQYGMCELVFTLLGGCVDLQMVTAISGQHRLHLKGVQEP
jgi:hypothetical protein